MRLTAFFLLGLCLHLSASSRSQTITLSGKDMAPVKVFTAIREQTGYTVFGNSSLLKLLKPVSLNVQKMPLAEFLKFIFQDESVGYEIEVKNKNIIIYSPGTRPLNTGKDPDMNIVLIWPLTGQVTDSMGMPLPGISVKIKGSRRGTVTDEKGQFRINVRKGDILQLSSVGYETKELIITDENNIRIILKEQVGDLKEVTINAGIITRNKNSFTGAVSTFSGQDLKKIGNLNVLQSLKSLDPSFIITPDNQLGSNPNQLPKIELRGKTSISTQTVRDQFRTDPNQPLFILNGMETTLQQIIDLDMNRVASITILKDAASTALYGSRAANGVVVVELIRPRAGELRINYNNDTRWEIPALGGYNMMSSAELLEYQKQAGLYSTYGFNNRRDDDALYNQRRRAVEEGVNSYWLNMPLRQSLTMGHSLSIGGGNEALLYQVGLNMRKLNGMMKGSDRTTWGGTIDLAYRKSNVNVSNRLYINGVRSNESPYGSFDQYVGMAPYYKKNRADGTLNTDRYLEVFIPSRIAGEDTVRVGNPLYNASLNNKNQTNQLMIQNQLSVLWDFTRSLRLSGGFQINKSTANVDVFVPAANTMFDKTPITRKGTFNNTRAESWGYQSNIMLTYNQVLNQVHSINANLRAEMNETNLTNTAFQAVGFPDAVEPNPAFAYSFTPDSRPGFNTVKTRQISALSSVNYALAGKYFADATFRIDGSTVFGSAKKYSPFWSAGLGWMISKEEFLKDLRWLSSMRLRGNIGTSGNQQLGSFASASVFILENDRNVFGQGLYIDALGNENLEWQKTYSTSVGLDLSLFNNRINATFNAYEKITKPLIVAGSAPASTGVTTYPLNVGQLATRGMEAILRFDVISKPEKRFLWNITLTGSFYKSKYSGFSNILKNLNEDAERNGTVIKDSKVNLGPEDITAALRRYLDGYSPDELWAVPSAGIDPATGMEVFIKQNGERTYVYDPADIRPTGNGRPQLEGVIGTSLTIRNLQIGVNLRYSLNNYLFNTALYQKVENISVTELTSNQDKRALYSRWKNPGDMAKFKGISITNFSPMSSRFIQKESFLSGESINISYELQGRQVKWVRRAGLNMIRVGAFMNDIFRISNVLIERGTDYPFSKAVSFNVNLFF
ncbi:SusC/RagA family TonB-linked outer membrane protein [Pseudoflavitalea rhizosphaerae]|uniref:SusC/RagA family TonB-linked outer membrane protein n=1 Tax=Pseudoflavitalea rhizosphaerae TaxID=1884793 RepID=UPI0013DF979D|nr:SusC/RagA family TonB-linked outer membrane protein [Pseudoflavitalea rhizosphaerae]